jgi:hypothetical protein
MGAIPHIALTVVQIPTRSLTLVSQKAPKRVLAHRSTVTWSYALTSQFGGIIGCGILSSTEIMMDYGLSA